MSCLFGVPPGVFRHRNKARKGLIKTLAKAKGAHWCRNAARLYNEELSFSYSPDNARKVEFAFEKTKKKTMP